MTEARASTALRQAGGLGLWVKRPIFYLALTVTFALTPRLALAHSGDVFYALLSTPVAVDGVLSPGEWSDASVKSFTLCGGLHPAQMFVKNDASHLYIAVVVENVPWNFDGPPGSGNDFLHVIFDNTHNGVVEVGEDDWAIRGGDGLVVDFFNQGGVAGWGLNDTFAGGTNDLTAAVTHSNPVWNGSGTYTVELKGPLNSLDDAHDFSVSPGDTLGATFLLADAQPLCTIGDLSWPSMFSGQYADILIAPVLDPDGDQVPSAQDNCPSAANADQHDADGDGHGDACDACSLDPANDVDGDGICGDVDNCSTVGNSSQADNDGDGVGDACDPDNDNDGVAAAGDNCPLVPNANQADSDADGVGNLCDADADGDGVVDGTDACLETAPGAIVDGAGCSIADVCPCSGTWKNHGGYVSCVARTAEAFKAAGLLSEAQQSATVSQAAKSTCGAR